MTPKQLLQQMAAEKYKRLDGNADKLIDWLLDELLATTDGYKQALLDYANSLKTDLETQKTAIADPTQIAAQQATIDAQIAQVNATVTSL